MAVKLVDSNPSNPTVSHLEAFETYICDLTQPSISIDVYLNFQGQTRCYHSHVYSYNQGCLEGMMWDDAELKTGMSKACDIINGPLTDALRGRELIPIKKVDDFIKLFKEREEETGNKIGENVTCAVSQALYFAVAKCLNPQMAFEGMFKNTTFKDYRFGHEKVPKLMFTVLNGGKELGSKVKFSKFFLIFDFDSENVKDVDVLLVYFKLAAAIEKAIASTKGGLTAFKRS